MPLYLYEHLETGYREHRMVPIAQRDAQPGWRRIFEPCKPLPPPGGGPRLSLQAQQVLDGYKRAEERGELTKSRAEADHIKEVWHSATEAAIAVEEREHHEKQERLAEANT